MRADSEASPIVGISNHSLVFKLYSQLNKKSFSFASFSSSDRCLSCFIFSCSASGGEGSKIATEQTTAHSCKALKEGSLISYSNGQVESSFCLFTALKTRPLYIRFAAIILFMVKVPVLSEQMQVVLPNVSTACKFLARTFFLASLLAVKVKAMVTSSKSPLGTLETVIPIARVRALIGSNPIPKPTDSTMMPKQIAAIPKRRTNRLISLFNGVYSSQALIAKPAICPMKVRSPVNMTTPLPEPELFKVEKKATFLVQRGLSGLVHSTTLDKSSVYPVREELSTFIPLDSTILMSAGIFLPCQILIRSPRTSFTEDIDFSTPSLITVISGGIKFLKDSIKALLFRFCRNQIKAEALTMTVMTIPRKRFP